MIVVETPFGKRLGIAGDERGICESRWLRPSEVPIARSAASGIVAEARRQLRAYFARRLRRFSVPLALDGTPFEVDVWTAVARLESGTIASYADVARAVGRPRSHRGVARAMAKAPLALFVPAHRVLGADGRLKGDDPSAMRRRLLRHEGIRL